MKYQKAYENLVIETILFETEDVIVTSGDLGGDGGGTTDTVEWD